MLKQTNGSTEETTFGPLKRQNNFTADDPFVFKLKVSCRYRRFQ